jgi:acyl-CoA thioesterase I
LAVTFGALVVCGAVALVPLLASAPTSAQHRAAPPTASATAHPSAPPPTAVAPTVLAIGDSVMKGYGVPVGQSWLDLLATQQNWSLLDRSCNGAGFIHVAPADCKTNLSGVIASAAPVAPQFVIVSGSANDFGTINSQLQAVTNQAFTTLRSEFPAAQIIALRVAWGDRTPPGKVAIIDAQVRTAAVAVHGQFIDFGTPLLGHPELMQADHLHPNAAGQLVLKSAIESALIQAGVVI